MKKIISLLLVLTLSLCLAAACSEKTAQSLTIAVPNDTTNEARALLLLEANGILKLKEGAGMTATKLDIAENPYNVTIVEIEAAQLPAMRQDVDFAVINSNFAAGAGLNPGRDALLREGAESPYANILAVKEGRENEPKLLALKAALESQAVADFFLAHGSELGAVATVANPTNGYDDSIDYEALKGETVTVAATPTPHARVLNEVVKGILAEKDIELKVVEFTDYVQPNNVVESGEIDANYFQHQPYLDDFNQEHGTHLVSIASVHVEPLGLYAGKQTDLKVFGK
ncbi:MAG: hypothetical protein IKD54_00325 [Clostridia bacterium]|nr:hypothetical protein [Clostridia bacterium]MBR3129876.1 hypothetical protein [Clostridia bacterium]